MDPLISAELDPEAPLRHVVERMNDALGHTEATPEVKAAWQRVRDVLALHGAPELRSCPYCRTVIMRTALRKPRAGAPAPAFRALATRPRRRPLTSCRRAWKPRHVGVSS